MAITTAIAIYFLIWWIVLFAVLPWGVRAQDEDSPPGTDPGAPRLPRLRAKLIWTTIISAIIYGIAIAAYHAGYLSIERLSRLMGMPF